MSKEILKVTATADVNDLIKGMRDARKQFAETAESSIKMDRSLKNGVKGSNQAAFALTNLGRVAQDAPFGFIGIQNNLNPLLESFQRLKVETGSTGGALKALASSLGGAGGLGLAFSLVSAAILIFQNGIAGFNKKTKEAGDNTEKLAKESEKAAESIKQVIGSLAQEQVKIDVIVAQLKEETLTRGQRNAAIEELQKISPEYFGTLDKEKATIAQITTSYNLYTASILKSIEAKVREKQLIDITEKILTLQRKGNEKYIEQILTNGKVIKIQNLVLDKNTSSINDNRTAYQKLQSQIKDNIATGTNTANLFSFEKEELDGLLKLRATILKELTPIASKGNGSIPKIKPESTKDVLTFTEVIAELQLQLDLLNAKEINLKTDESKAKINALERAIDDLVTKVGLKTNDKRVLKLFGDIKIIENDIIQKRAREIATTAEKIIGAEEIKAKLFLKIDASKFNLQFIFDEIKRKEKEVEERLRSFQELFGGIAQDLAYSFGEGIAKAISGGGISGFFSTIFSELGAGLKKLGVYFITTSKLIQTIKASILKAPSLGIIGGIALIALGSLIQSSVSKQKAFATGVRGFDGGFATVGERGPERVFLPKGSSVIPNAQSAAMGGGQSVFIPDVKLSGRDIYLSFKREEKYSQRNGF